jgi:chromosome segregation ATPase
MTNISKSLAVLATVASLAFLGVVSMSAVGGPNFEAEISDPTLNGVYFEKKVDESTGKVTWSAQSQSAPAGGDLQIVKDGKVLADVILKAQQRVQQLQTQRAKELDDRIKLRKLQIEEARRLYATDIQAMAAREAELRKQLAAQQKKLEEVKAERDATLDKSLQKIKEKKRRDNDIRRLGHLIAELQADRERLVAQQNKLQVLIETIRGTNQRLRERHQQLLERTTASKAAAAP